MKDDLKKPDKISDIGQIGAYTVPELIAKYEFDVF